MLAKRIIPCLDIKDGQTVKGINFEDKRFTHGAQTANGYECRKEDPKQDPLI